VQGLGTCNCGGRYALSHEASEITVDGKSIALLAQVAQRLRRSNIREGKPFPLGATWDGLGVNFALFSANATKVELCLFDDRGERELERIELPEYPMRYGTAIFPPHARAPSMAIERMARSSPTRATASIPTSLSSILMPNSWSVS